MADQFAYPDAPPETTADAATFRAEHVAGWQSEVAQFLGECLEEVRSVSALLQSLEGRTPPEPAAPFRVTAAPAASPQPDVPTSPQPAMPAFERPAAFEPEQSAEAPGGDFDARLANLKKLLAEKLTDSES
ncbi:MAG: hypothetical protein ACE5KM_02210 [Planctomycetaceae bacterium]